VGASAFAGTLVDAVREGDTANVRASLAKHANVNAPDADGTTPIHAAVEAGDLETVKLLLRAGANANAESRNGVTPLSMAVTAANPEIAKALLNSGANAKYVLLSGETILMAAARAGNSEIVAQLLAHGADPNAAAPAFGETALMMAASGNRPAAVQALLAAGAKVDTRSEDLTYSKDRFGLEGVLTILPHGSWTALMYAARDGAKDAADALCKAGANVNLADPDGATPLELAIVNSHYDTAALLVERGADVNQTDTAGMAPLYATVDMNTLGEVYGRPSRMQADKLTALDLMKVLLDHHADPNAGLKTAALQRAHTPGEPSLAEGATPLMRAAKNGDVVTIELLVANGADVSRAQKNGTTALMFASGLGRGTGTFAKDYATDAQVLEAAKALVAHGADVNAVSAAGQTAMHFAAEARDPNLPAPTDDTVLFLAAHGAKLDVADRQGRTPVEMAQGKGLRGRAGGPVKARENTVALLKQLSANQ
jgi:ankyrin repeat protein